MTARTAAPPVDDAGRTPDWYAGYQAAMRDAKKIVPPDREAGLREAADWFLRSAEGRCSNPRCPSEHEGSADDCFDYHAERLRAALASDKPGLREADWDTFELAVQDAANHEFPSVRKAIIRQVFAETRAALLASDKPGLHEDGAS